MSCFNGQMHLLREARLFSKSLISSMDSLAGDLSCAKREKKHDESARRIEKSRGTVSLSQQ